MEKIILYSENVEIFLNNLVDILYEREYFGFQDDAHEYVSKITDFITENISIYPAKNTSEVLQKFGEKYILYKANTHTTWYIFYDQDDNRFLINLIVNNHADFIQKFNL